MRFYSKKQYDLLVEKEQVYLNLDQRDSKGTGKSNVSLLLLNSGMYRSSGLADVNWNKFTWDHVCFWNIFQTLQRSNYDHLLISNNCALSGFCRQIHAERNTCSCRMLHILGWRMPLEGRSQTFRGKYLFSFITVSLLFILIRWRPGRFG